MIDKRQMVLVKHAFFSQNILSKNITTELFLFASKQLCNFGVLRCPDLALDFVGKFPTGEMILVIVDYYSR
jgi:hypothetical protein